MDFENKILSREVHQILYESGKTVGTAESCTGGKIAESLIAVPGASTYFKGSVISYTEPTARRENCSLRGGCHRNGQRRNQDAQR